MTGDFLLPTCTGLKALMAFYSAVHNISLDQVSSVLVLSICLHRIIYIYTIQLVYGFCIIMSFINKK